MYMKAYSVDLRQKIVRAYDNKLGTQYQIAEIFGVSRAFVQNVLRRRRTTGSIAPLPQRGGAKRALDDEALRVVRRLVNQRPDATLEELCEAVDVELGIRVSVPTMCTVLNKRLGLPRKKSHSTPMSGTLRGYSRRERSSERKSPNLTPAG